MTAPVRPIFRNGQRLTAERLTEAFEFLRDWVRRVSLGPLSAGIGSGLDLSPLNGAVGDVVISPGVAIDGRGRLLVLETEQRFTRANIEARVGLLNSGDVVRVLLTLDELSSDAASACNSSSPQRVVENVSITFVRDGFLDNSNDPGPLLGSSHSCVNPWENLDSSTSAGCGVTLGHAIVDANGQLTASRRFRQGVSPRIGTLFDSSGVPALTTGEMKIDFGSGPFVSNAVAVVAPTFFTKNVRFVGTTTANASGAQFAQATVIAPLNTPFTTAGLWDKDLRVFAVMGGSNDPVVPGFQGGLSAVACALDTSAGGNVTVPGEPLFLADVSVGTTPRVGRSGSASNLIGLSAASGSFLGGTTVVPVATAGLVKVTVEHTGGALPIGALLTAHPSTPGHLVVASAGQYVIARAAQSVPTAGSGSSIFAWVVHPAFQA